MAEPTTYIVLARFTHKTPETENIQLWQVENANVPATSAEAAIRLACKNAANSAGTYVAVPLRSFRPVTVSAVQTTVLKLEEAGRAPAEPT